jgi:hypothetical protein
VTTTQTELPDPLVPAGVDMTGFDYMPLKGNRLFRSDFNAHATDAEWRAGVTLWWEAWNQIPAASLPSDDVALARLAGFGRDVRAWKKVRRRALHGFVLCSDGRLYHEMLAEFALEADGKRRYDRERQRKHRAGLAAKKGQDRVPLSQGRHSVTSADVAGEEKRSEEKRRESPPPRVTDSAAARDVPQGGGGGGGAAAIVDEFLRLRGELFPHESSLAAATMTLATQAAQFLETGAPTELVIELLRREMRREAPTGQAPTSLKAFHRSIGRAIAQHLASGRPLVLPRAADRPQQRGGDMMAARDAERSQWTCRLQSFFAGGQWFSQWGPKPGERGCMAPDDLVAELRPSGRSEAPQSPAPSEAIH